MLRASIAVYVLLALVLRTVVAQQPPQDVLPEKLTFIWNDPVGDRGCTVVQAGTQGNAVPLELRRLGTAGSEHTVELDVASDFLLNGETCSESGSPRTLSLRPGPPPPIPHSTKNIAMDVVGGHLAEEIRDKLGFAFGGAVVGEDGTAAEAFCPQPTANQTVLLSRAFLFRFNMDFRVSTLDPEKPFQFRVGVVYAAMEFDAGFKAELGNTTRLLCFFAEAPPGFPAPSFPVPSRTGSTARVSVGVIVGIVGGGVAVLVLFTVCLCYAMSVHRKREAERSDVSPNWVARAW